MLSAPRPGDEGTAASRQFYVWDAWNRLRKVYADTDGDALFEPTTNDTLVATYDYDGQHKRIRRSVW